MVRPTGWRYYWHCLTGSCAFSNKRTIQRHLDGYAWYRRRFTDGHYSTRRGGSEWVLVRTKICFKIFCSQDIVFKILVSQDFYFMIFGSQDSWKGLLGGSMSHRRSWKMRDTGLNCWKQRDSGTLMNKLSGHSAKTRRMG